MLKLLLDSRESSLISSIKSRDLDTYTHKISINTQQLDVGDILIQTDNKSWIFERKTVSDLISSVKDGRYKEQKGRLISTYDTVTYIIEGDDIISSKNERNQTLLSSIYVYTLYRDNIKLIFTRNIEETTTFILTMCTKIIDKPEKLIPSEKQEGDNKKSYLDLIKIKKIDNITPNICYIMQLSQIPTISTVIAKYIQNIYPTMKSLLNALDNTEEKVQLLCKIEKIGKEKAIKILEYLHYVCVEK